MEQPISPQPTFALLIKASAMGWQSRNVWLARKSNNRRIARLSQAELHAAKIKIAAMLDWKYSLTFAEVPYDTLRDDLGLFLEKEKGGKNE